MVRCGEGSQNLCERAGRSKWYAQCVREGNRTKYLVQSKTTTVVRGVTALAPNNELKRDVDQDKVLRDCPQRAVDRRVMSLREKASLETAVIPHEMPSYILLVGATARNSNLKHASWALAKAGQAKSAEQRFRLRVQSTVFRL